MDLHDRVVLITGASGGLGAVTARMLASHVVHVAVTHLGHREEAVDTCRVLVQAHRQAQIVSGGLCGDCGYRSGGILWSDWGKPERIVEFLRALGKQPLFSVPEFQLI